MDQVATGRTAITRIPLNTFAIALSLTGLAEAWSDAGAVLGLPVPLTEAFWILAAIVAVWMVVAHIVRGTRSEETLASQLTHPAQGPVAAILPLIGMLFGINLHSFWPVGGTVLIVAAIVAAGLFSAWILAFWMRGELALDSVHGAYFLPGVAASLLAGGAASVIGARPLAIGAFAVGGLLWVVMFVLVGARLAFRPSLPAPLVPTMTILMAPPAVAGISWFAYDGGRIDIVEQGLLGLAVILVLMQVLLLPRYRKLTFSLGFWSFGFPTAFMGAFAIVAIGKAPFAGWQVVASVILGLATILIVALAVFSVRMYFRGRARATTPRV
jgi:tellurite resistance protein